MEAIREIIGDQAMIHRDMRVKVSMSDRLKLDHIANRIDTDRTETCLADTVCRTIDRAANGFVFAAAFITAAPGMMHGIVYHFG